mmetsp:Transcript_30764/g.75001  ORF Transcript_30764/g.75001 Transcript_30764/m.75001 type:complete len:281 (-) Transcript_30764:288-1130(-)
MEQKEGGNRGDEGSTARAPAKRVVAAGLPVHTFWAQVFRLLAEARDPLAGLRAGVRLCRTCRALRDWAASMDSAEGNGVFWRRVFERNGARPPPPRPPPSVDKQPRAICWRGEVRENFRTVKRLLARIGMPVQDPMSEEQLAAAEARFGFTFPPDLRFLYRIGAPRAFHDYRELKRVRCGPEDQVEWHAIPEGKRELYPSDKPLIPIYGHRMMPSFPCEPWNPIFSMHQDASDCIVYGLNLWIYLVNDFAKARYATVLEDFPPAWRPNELKRIPFWEDFI